MHWDRRHAGQERPAFGTVDTSPAHETPRLQRPGPAQAGWGLYASFSVCQLSFPRGATLQCDFAYKAEVLPGIGVPTSVARDAAAHILSLALFLGMVLAHGACLHTCVCLCLCLCVYV